MSLFLKRLLVHILMVSLRKMLVRTVSISKPPGVSQKGSVVDFDDRIRTEFFLGEVVEKQK